MTTFWQTLCMSVLMMVAITALGQVEFRAIGGPGIDHGKLIIPHANGAFLLGSTQPEDVELLRSYVVHYNNELDVEWSLVLPSSDALEWIVDAQLDSANAVQILTRRLRTNGTYAAAIHIMDASGALQASTELNDVTINFVPVQICQWQGETWVVGHSGNKLVAGGVSSGTVIEWGGAVGQEDFISDVLVHNNMLVAVGKRIENEESTAAIWGVYPLGQLAFEIVSPNEENWLESQMDAIDSRGNSIRILRTYQFTDGNGNVQISHDFLGLNIMAGTAGAYWSGAPGQAGRDIVMTGQGMAKLLKSDNDEDLDQSFLISHVSATASYIDQGHYGTSFEEEPSQIAAGPDGSIWAAGSTRGVLDGTWSACILRLDSLGPLGNWSNGTLGFGVVNDPNLQTWDNVTSPSESRTEWACYPNPTDGLVNLTPPTLNGSNSNLVTWSVIDIQGRKVKSGQGTPIGLSELKSGKYTIHGQGQGQSFILPVVKSNH